jgi:hypothetical protein
VAAHNAEPAQPRGQPQTGLSAVGIGEAERQCGADVVELGLETVQPDGFVRASQVQAGRLDESQVVITMGGAGFLQLRAGPPGQAFGGVVANRLQQPVPRRTLDLVGLDQALADQGSQLVKHLPLPGSASCGDRFGGLQGPAPGEHGKLAEQELLFGVEQVIGPVDQGAKGLMARQGGPAPSGQQPEPLIEPGADL